MTSPAEAIFSVSPSVAWLDAETVGFDRDEVYLARVPDGRPLVLSGTAAVIWSYLEPETTAAGIAARIAADAGLSAGEIEPDVADFLGWLTRLGLVSRTVAPDPPADGA